MDIVKKKYEGGDSQIVHRAKPMSVSISKIFFNKGNCRKKQLFGISERLERRATEWLLAT